MQTHYLVTDFDRINAGVLYDGDEALRKADELARRHPGNEIHVLATIATRKVERVMPSVSNISDEDAVKRRHPGAHLFAIDGGKVALVLLGAGFNTKVLGRGQAAPEAWHDARLLLDGELSNEASVKRREPGARAHEYGPGGSWPSGRWSILDGAGPTLRLLGRGHDEAQAWADARTKLDEVDAKPKDA